jgi:hypothetical protein
MKNFDSCDGLETRAPFNTGLTLVPPLWNHPKTVCVAQTILPVRFPGACQPLLEAASDLDRAAGEKPPKRSVERSNFYTRAYVR